MSLPDQIDELCDAWADQWQIHSCPDLKQFLAETDPELLNAALSILIPMDFNLRRSKRPGLEATDYKWLGDDAVAIAERCCVRSVVTDSSGAGQRADSAGRNGLWRFQSECDEPNADSRQDDAHAPELSDFPAQVGEYRIVELVGGGGQGVVAKAVHERAGRAAAVKFIRPELAASLPVRRRFLRESTIARSIRHPNVVRFLSIEEKPQLCIVMEFVNGKTLDTLIREHGTLPLSHLLSIGVQIAAGLQAVHSANIVHRDLKPMNILLETGDSPLARISDFGVARFSGDPGITRSGTIVGSAAWLSPEQALEKPVTEKSDLFSLGSILYCMACGQSPFLRPTLMATLNAIVQDDPVGVKVIRPELPNEFCRLLDELLAKEPAARPSSAGEVAERLRSIPGMPNTRPTEIQPADHDNVAVPKPLRQVGRRTILSAIGFVAGASLIKTAQSFLSGETSNWSEGKMQPSTEGRTADGTAPAGLVVPCTLSEVRSCQTQWATHLGIPAEFDAGNGIKFTLVPPIHFSAQQQRELHNDLRGLNVLASTGGFERSMEDHNRVLTSPFFAATQPLSYRQVSNLCDGTTADFPRRPSNGSGHDEKFGNISDENVAAVTWNEARELRAKSEQQVFLQERLRSIAGLSAISMTLRVDLPKPIEWMILARLLQIEEARQLTRINIAQQIQIVSQSGLVSGNRGKTSSAVEITLFGTKRVTQKIRAWVTAETQSEDVQVTGTIQILQNSEGGRCTWSAGAGSGELAEALFWPVIHISSHEPHSPNQKSSAASKEIR